MKKLFKFIIFVILIIGFIYLGTRDYKVKVTKKPSEKNASSILINEDTVFKQINHSQVLNKLSTKDDSIIYICVDGNKLCTKYGLMIDEAAKSYNISKIFYYDIKSDRISNNGTYQKILTKLDNYLYTDDIDEKELHVPTLIFIKKGEIYSFDDELSDYNGKKDINDFWSEELQEVKLLHLNEVMEGYLLNE